MVRIRHLILLAVLILTPSMAQAEVTCDREDPATCCKWWTLDIDLDGRREGAMLEDSYEKLIKRRDARTSNANSVCEFYRRIKDPGPATRRMEHYHCDSTFSAPRCDVAGGVKKETLLQMVDETTAGKKKLLQDIIEKTLEKIGKYSKTIKRLSDGIKSLKTLPDGKPNPYRGVGSILLGYGKLLTESEKRVRELEQRLQWEFKADIIWAGGSYGLDGSEDKILSEILQVQENVGDVGNTIHGISPGMRIPGLENPILYFSPEETTTHQSVMDSDGMDLDVEVVKTHLRSSLYFNYDGMAKDQSIKYNCWDGNSGESTITLQPSEDGRSSQNFCEDSSIKSVIFASSTPKPKPVAKKPQKRTRFKGLMICADTDRECMKEMETFNPIEEVSE
jgi:hypothetical protein